MVSECSYPWKCHRRVSFCTYSKWFCTYSKWIYLQSVLNVEFSEIMIFTSANKQILNVINKSMFWMLNFCVILFCNWRSKKTESIKNTLDKSCHFFTSNHDISPSNYIKNCLVLSRTRHLGSSVESRARRARHVISLSQNASFHLT